MNLIEKLFYRKPKMVFAPALKTDKFKPGDNIGGLGKTGAIIIGKSIRNDVLQGCNLKKDRNANIWYWIKLRNGKYREECEVYIRSDKEWAERLDSFYEQNLSNIGQPGFSEKSMNKVLELSKSIKH